MTYGGSIYIVDDNLEDSMKSRRQSCDQSGEHSSTVTHQDDDINIEDLLTARQRCHPAKVTMTSAPRIEDSHVELEAAENATDDDSEPTMLQQQLLTPGPSEEGYSLMVPRSYRQQSKKAPRDINLDPYDTSGALHLHLRPTQIKTYPKIRIYNRQASRLLRSY